MRSRLVSLAPVLLVLTACGGGDPEPEDAGPAPLDVSACEDLADGPNSASIEVEETSVTLTSPTDPTDDLQAGLGMIASTGCVVDELGAPSGTADVLISEGTAEWSGFTADYSDTASGPVVIVQRT